MTSAVGETQLLANPLIVLGSVDFLGGVNWMFLAIAYSIQSTDAVSFPYRNRLIHKAGTVSSLHKCFICFKESFVLRNFTTTRVVFTHDNAVEAPELGLWLSRCCLASDSFFGCNERGLEANG